MTTAKLTPKDAPAVPSVGIPLDRTVGRPAPERDIADMTNAELQAEIGRMQQELVRRICGDPVRGMGLRLGAHPTCWCRACDRTVSPLPQRMNLCPACGDKRCDRAEFHGNECTKTPNEKLTGPRFCGSGSAKG